MVETKKNAQVRQEMALGCAPERKVSDVPFFGQYIPWKMRPLNDASHERYVP
jgi:hypothetical protein